MPSSKSAAPFAVAIMAAGKGTRLKSKHPKVLFEVGGRPLLAHVIAAASQVAAPGDIFAIIGHEADRVREAVQCTGVNFVLQEEQKGTGHAVMCARDALKNYAHVLVLSGDVPLLSAETIRRLRDFHVASSAAMTLLSTDFANPTGYGRIVRRRIRGKDSDEVKQIVEEKQTNAAQKKITEINAGIYSFDTTKLLANLDKLRTDNPHGEYYLTDIANILNKAGEKVIALKTADAHEVAGANTRAEMAERDREVRARKCAELMAAGVSIFKPETCLIDTTVMVAADTIIEPFVQLLGTTRVGSDCRIRSYSVITDCDIADGVTVRHGCIMDKSRIASGAMIGP